MHQLSRRRSIYLVAIAIGLPALAFAWWLQRSVDAFGRYAHLGQGLFLVWAFVVLWREAVPVPQVERATYWTLSLLWLGNYGVGLHTGQAFEVGWSQFVTTVMINFFVLAVLSHLIFSTMNGFRINLAMAGACVVIGLSRLLPDALGGLHGEELTSLIQFGIGLTVVVCFLYVLAKSKDDHLAAELQARTLGEYAFSDFLTGLPNRRRLMADLERLVETGRRYGRPLSLVSFDLDHFKSINDTFGHSVGDEVLVEVAARVKGHLRESDVVGRWGGEEFLILTPETDAEHAMRLADRIRDAIARGAYPRGIRVTASFGVVAMDAGATSDDLLREVDRRLYLAKEGGRNRVAATEDPAEPRAGAAEPHPLGEPARARPPADAT